MTAVHVPLADLFGQPADERLDEVDEVARLIGGHVRAGDAARVVLLELQRLAVFVVDLVPADPEVEVVGVLDLADARHLPRRVVGGRDVVDDRLLALASARPCRISKPSSSSARSGLSTPISAGCAPMLHGVTESHRWPTIV